MNAEDWYLESLIVDTLAATPDGEGPQATARRILTAIADRNHRTWVVTDIGLYAGKPSHIRVVGDIGESEASSTGCTHLWQYSNETIATDEQKNPDNVDYLHICCLDDHITRMVALRELKHRAEEGDNDLPGCPHSSAEYMQPDAEPRPCQACGEPVTKGSPVRPPKVTNTPDLLAEFREALRVPTDDGPKGFLS